MRRRSCRLQAFRALNQVTPPSPVHMHTRVTAGDSRARAAQCVGRCIRHRHDYGAIILLDNRFAAGEVTQQMSRWLRGQIRPGVALAAAAAAVDAFFKELAEHPPGGGPPAAAPGTGGGGDGGMLVPTGGGGGGDNVDGPATAVKAARASKRPLVLVAAMPAVVAPAPPRNIVLVVPAPAPSAAAAPASPVAVPRYLCCGACGAPLAHAEAGFEVARPHLSALDSLFACRDVYAAMHISIFRARARARSY